MLAGSSIPDPWLMSLIDPFLQSRHLYDQRYRLEHRLPILAQPHRAELEGQRGLVLCRLHVVDLVMGIFPSPRDEREDIGGDRHSLR